MDFEELFDNVEIKPRNIRLNENKEEFSQVYILIFIYVPIRVVYGGSMKARRMTVHSCQIGPTDYSPCPRSSHGLALVEEETF